MRTSSSFSSSPSASASRYSTSSRIVGSTSASSSSGVGSRPCSTAAAARACATCSAVTTIRSRPAETDSPRQADTANNAAPISQEMHERIFEEPRHRVAREENGPGLWPRAPQGHKRRRSGAEKKGSRPKGGGRLAGTLQKPQKADRYEKLKATNCCASPRRTSSSAVSSRSRARVQRGHDLGNVADGLLVDARDDVAGPHALLGRSAIRSRPPPRRRRRRRSGCRASRDRRPSAAAA